MNVLMFGWEFPPHISGGLGTACYGLTRALGNRGVNVIFVVPRMFGNEENNFFHLVDASDIAIDIGSEATRITWDNLTVVRVASSLAPYVSPEQYLDHLRRDQSSAMSDSGSPFATRFALSGQYGSDLMTEVARYALVASTLASNSAFDVIHAHDWLTFPAGIAAKRVSGKPLVVHVHATEYDRSGEAINHDVYAVEKAGLDAADRIIAVSRYTKHILMERYGIDGGKITVVHNGVAPHNATWHKSEMHKPANPIVTYLGRITFQKGPEYFVEAARKVLLHCPDVHFVMAGNGDMLTKMITLVAEHDMGTRFHFTGFLEGGEVDGMYAMSDVYVMPSVSEPFGISPLEAMQADVPVIISTQSGVSEVLHSAIKLDFWDTDAMADAICALLEHGPLSRALGRSGSEEVRALSWDRAAESVQQVYSSLMCEAIS